MEDYPGEKMCAGPLCMGWVNELDETGKPTGKGRCEWCSSKYSSLCRA